MIMERCYPDTVSGVRLSVLIPTKDGERYLPEILAAVRREAPEAEILVVDSGSRDDTVRLARRAGARVHEIAPGEFGHGRTRNLAAELASGEILVFLTQDATPQPGWAAALLAPFADPAVGVVGGAQRPRPGVSPMAARQVAVFFEQLEPGDGYLSNVNAAYRRACWEEVRFRDIAYAEDHAFAADLETTRWTLAYARDAVVLHAHDYGALGFMRRAFDEARGRREAQGWVERFAPRGSLTGILRQVRRDLAWMRREGWSPARRARWVPASLLHHTGRKLFAWLGSRAERLPPRVRRVLSLERRAD
jgi:glycosyltransferase involved in cell wall biosynthesis